MLFPFAQVPAQIYQWLPASQVDFHFFFFLSAFAFKVDFDFSQFQKNIRVSTPTRWSSLALRHKSVPIPRVYSLCNDFHWAGTSLSLHPSLSLSVSVSLSLSQHWVSVHYSTCQRCILLLLPTTSRLWTSLLNSSTCHHHFRAFFPGEFTHFSLHYF